MTFELPTTQDALFQGRVHLDQPARGHGYRVNVDSILLAAFALSTKKRARFALDLGAGVGAVGICLCHLGQIDRLLLIEKDSALADLARRNLARNDLLETASVLTADVAQPLARTTPDVAHHADLVVANPPYVEVDAGARSHADSSQKSPSDAARRGHLDPFLQRMAEALSGRGRACIVYPAASLSRLFAGATLAGLVPKRMRMVHGRVDRPARIALVEMRAGGLGGLVAEPPLIETDPSGKATEEMGRLLVTDRHNPGAIGS